MNHLGNANKMVGEDHIRDATKMVSDTPRTDMEMFEMTTGDGPVKTRTKWVHYTVCAQIERALNWASKERDGALAMLAVCEMELKEQKQRIKRLEEAGDAMAAFCNPTSLRLQWHKAKEAKP